MGSATVKSKKLITHSTTYSGLAFEKQALFIYTSIERVKSHLYVRAFHAKNQRRRPFETLLQEPIRWLDGRHVSRGQSPDISQEAKDLFRESHACSFTFQNPGERCQSRSLVEPKGHKDGRHPVPHRAICLSKLICNPGMMKRSCRSADEEPRRLNSTHRLCTR